MRVRLSLDRMVIAFQSWHCKICVKNRWGGERKYFHVNFCFGGVLIVGEWEVVGWWQKVLFRASWNRIFCLLLLLKSWSLRGASHHPVFMVLMLIKGIKRGGESNISFGFLREFESYPLNLPRGRWCNLVRVECL